MEKEKYIIVIGVSGSGKTLIGKMLAKALAIEFMEGDDLHPKANIDKMKSGIALNDSDRWPWLNIIKEKISAKIVAKKSFVLSCSALKVAYRDLLREAGNIRFLFLNVSEEEVAKRLKHREDHFMPSSLLHSQIEALENPSSQETDVIFIDAGKKPEMVVSDCISKL
ncbi:gluconokinase [Pedobacter sp. SD-b]|uniref:Gluconokinase n=1 Tax=Pedobacter segetis TaxID=2793069 RepID=A0ABS1BIH0_9SPHI|nr:gluconokinase [Pedobacter segetis]MBK0382681.1 gluconokinase [Pedobacter segetis]